MKTFQTFWLAPVVASMLAGLAIGSACGSSSTVTFPFDASPIPQGFDTTGVVGFPSGCQGQVYYEADASSLCPVGSTFFLCDGTTYTEYDCDPPGAGWAVENAVPDEGAEDSGGGEGGSGSGSGEPDAASDGAASGSDDDAVSSGGSDATAG